MSSISSWSLTKCSVVWQGLAIAAVAVSTHRLQAAVSISRLSWEFGTISRWGPGYAPEPPDPDYMPRGDPRAMFLLHRLPTARIVVPSTVGPSVRRGLRRTILDCWLRSPPSSFQKAIIVIYGACVVLRPPRGHLRPDQGEPPSCSMPWPLYLTMAHCNSNCGSSLTSGHRLDAIEVSRLASTKEFPSSLRGHRQVFMGWNRGVLVFLSRSGRSLDACVGWFSFFTCRLLILLDSAQSGLHTAQRYN
jgi:hypothetical protein